MSARILYLDIETSPIVAHVWSLRDQNVGINQIVRDPEILGVGYKADEQRTKYASMWDRYGRQGMLNTLRDKLDWCDIAVHYNGDRFDIPWLNGEFAREDIPPPSPFKNLDLYKIIKKAFRFPSHKLAYVSTALGLEGKIATGGHELWMRYMQGDPKARRLMARYCKQDVDLLPPLLEKVRPFIPATVNFALYEGEEFACQKCGKADFLRPKGTAYTATRAYPQYLCDKERGGCGGWTRDVRSSHSTQGTGVAR